VRRGKLKVDESWGFPKLSVEVPDADPLRRRRTQPSGLTVYVLTATVATRSPRRAWLAAPSRISNGLSDSVEVGGAVGDRW